MTEIRELRASGELGRQSGHRRAAVLYVDRGSGFLPYISWWLHAWKLSGLNTSSEMFDLVIFTHPESGRVEDWGVRDLHKNGQNLVLWVGSL